MLVLGKVNGVVFDTPTLKYHLREYPELPVKLANFSLAIENYGFALPLNSPYTQQLNVKLLQLQQSGKLKEIGDRWLYIQDCDL